MRRRALPFLAVVAASLLPRPAEAFFLNGKVWAEMPVPFFVNPANQPEFPNGKNGTDVVQIAASTWNAVSCSTAELAYQGTTEATWAKDGRNTVFFVNDNWAFGEQAAGATLWIPTEEGESMEVDLALNMVNFEWVWGGGDVLDTTVVDPVAVITHEFGHWLGLSHSPDPFATMFLAHLPNGMQSSLEADDKSGLCALYPNPDEPEECETDQDCLLGEMCVIGFDGPSACGQTHEPAGEKCNADYLNCEGMCWVSFYECDSICYFTAEDLSEGYCSNLCTDDPAICPAGWYCDPVPDYDIAVCVKGEDLPEEEPEPGPELGPEVAPEAVPEAVEALPEPIPETGAEPDAGNGGDAGGAEDLVEAAPEAEQTGGSSGDGGCAAGGTAVPGAMAAFLLLLAAGVRRRRG